jgi:hypothetical protein
MYSTAAISRIWGSLTTAPAQYALDVRRAALGVVLLLALTACGGTTRSGGDPTRSGTGSGPSPADVVRDWSAALDAYDNDRAASLFAPNIAIVQGDQLVRLRTHGQAVAWNKGLPCAGKIVSLRQNGSSVEATFRIRSGPHRHCQDPAGAEATAIIVVEHGKIILWAQIESKIALGH